MECTMAPPPQAPVEIPKDAVSTTCSVSNMSISSDVDSDVASICRDFIRGVCSRKKRCKFAHPTVAELNALVGCREDKKYEFCHDHQNKTCERTTCRYIHCTSEEEQNFLKSRHLPLRYKCQYELGIYNVALNNKAMREMKRESENKRLRPIAYSNSANDLNSHHKRSSTSISTNFSDHQMSYSYQQILDESSKMRKENDMLKQRIEELQKKCADLSTVNEMLLEQNAKYRHVLNSSQPPPPAVPMEAQPVLSSNPHRVMAMPPPGIPTGVQSVAVPQNMSQSNHVEVQLSTAQTVTGVTNDKRPYQQQSAPLVPSGQFRPSSNVIVNQVPVVTMHNMMTTPIRPGIEQPQNPSVQVTSSENLQTQIVTTYASQAMPRPAINGQPHMTVQPTMAMQQTPIQYTEMPSLPVHHQHP
ncbi:Oidioi.mRNA.OKI2018_I69.PAR.g12102.t1.cds [Oikopleura dioica]|uniref:Oidioi.mRNA.OKI2018_I69.PAR.g12102.t1.cds n=1 Tax=Oikopleura dioica TaxID=34765 RepID=A0ABN7S1T9_OIKDI|nr:Oidioi.mRNA.OKI2018_I69.PAR.g12102.t1.cds [Oikopleura dioica]